MTEAIPATIQQSVINLLVFGNENAITAKESLPVEVWMADRALSSLIFEVYGYIDAYKKTPGKHVYDIILGIDGLKDSQKDDLKRLIEVCELKYDADMNYQYVMDEIGKFHKLSLWKEVVQKSAELIVQGRVAEIQNLYDDMSKKQIISFDAGTRLDQVIIELYKEKDRGNASEVVQLGIPCFDKEGIQPKMGEMIVWLGGAKSGKSFALVHCGKRALFEGKKVLHITLEMSEAAVGQRYLQTFFGMSTHYSSSEQTRFFIKDGNISFEKVAPPKNLSDNLYEVAGDLSDKFPYAIDNLVIKGFPSGTLTLAMYRALLDGLQRIHDFIPNEVCFDYPAIAKIDPDNKRAGLEQWWIDLRGEAQLRHHALVAAHQTNRGGNSANTVKVEDSAEDFSVIRHADNVLTISKSAQERYMNMARIGAGAVRNGRGEFSALITQNYDTAQFCNTSHELTREMGVKLQTALDEFGIVGGEE